MVFNGYFKTKRMIGKLLGPFIFVIVLAAIGVITLNSNKKAEGFVETEATIVDVRATNASGVLVEFEVGGEKVIADYPEYSDSLSRGDEVTIYYNPNNPKEIVIVTSIYIYLFIGAGILFIIGIANIIIQIKKAKDMKDQEKDFKDYQNKVEMYGDDLENPKYDEDRVYHFVTNPEVRNMILKDANGDVIFNITCDKYKLFGGSEYKFEDMVNFKSNIYKITSVTKVENGGGFAGHEEYFKINGVKCWDYFHNLGFRIKTEVFSGGLNLTYNVERYGMPYAKFVTENPGVAGDPSVAGFNMGVLSKVTLPGFFNITTKEQNLELIMLLGYTFSSVTQLVQD